MATKVIKKVPAHLSKGLLRTVWVPESAGIKDINAPTISELENSAVIELSPYMTSDGWELDHSQDSVDDDRESTATTGKILGADTFGDGAITIVDNTNTSDSGENNLVAEQLTRGSRGFFVRRRGKATTEAWKAGDKVSVIPAEIGIKSAADGDRLLSKISFSADPTSTDGTSVVASGAGIGA